MVITATGFLVRLEERMKERGFTRSILASETGINLNTIHGYWKYDRIPRGDDLVRMAEALGTTCEYLITGSQPRSQDEDPVTGEIASFVRRLSEREKMQVYGAVKMLLYLKLTEKTDV